MQRLKECDREPLTTLFFPWVRNIAGSQRGLLVDRTFLADAAHKVLNRIAADGFKSRTSGFVMALHSLGHLMTSGKKNTVFKRALKLDPGLEHPSLFEVSIQRGVTAEGLQPYDHFLGRLRRCTWINEAKERLRAAMAPGETPFLLVGIHPTAPAAKALRAAGFDPRHEGVVPHVLLLDLTRSSRDRLEHWRRAVPGLLGVMSDLYGASSPPALAVTDDPFILQTLRWDVLKRYDQRRTGASDKTPTRARAILSTNPDIIEGQVIVATGSHTVRVETYGNDILSLVEAGLKLRKTFVHAEEYELADTVSDVISVAQSMVGAPAATPQLNEFIGHHAEGYERQRVGARFDYLKPTGEMKTALQQGLAGAQHGALSKLLRSFEELCDRTRASSASQILCDESLRRLVAQGGRVLVVCSSEFICGLLLWRIENDETLANVRARIGQGVVIADRREAVERLADGAAGRFDHVFFVEPQADDLLHVLVTQENPIEAHVLCNLARAEQSLRRVRILIDLPGTEPVSAILRAVQTELERVLKGRSSDIPDLDDELPLPRVRTVDLTGDDYTPALGNRRVLRTAGGIVIRAYDGSEIAVYDPDSVQVFSRKLAKDVTPDDRICVFTPDFVAMAREKLHLSRDASDVLGLYHDTVVKAVRQLAGKDIAAKIRTLRTTMQNIDRTIQLPSDQQLRYWIDIEHLPGMARDEVTPHAPRDRRHFLCFMQALGIGPDVARHYWDLGIFWTRSMRLRSGASFHQVFMGILIDPHGTAALLRPDRREEVWRILETAEQHVVTVSSNEVEVNE
jgi:hypothetical protein